MIAVENLDDPIGVAVEQLHVAIELFLTKRSYISAVTLAGASEKLFERALIAKGQQTALQWEFDIIDQHERIQPFFGIYQISLPEKQRFAAFEEFKRRERNFANHGPDNHGAKKRIEQSAQRPSLADVAEEAIDRACENLLRLELPASNKVKQFYDWFYKEALG
jgi:hypothetical protein